MRALTFVPAWLLVALPLLVAAKGETDLGKARAALAQNDRARAAALSAQSLRTERAPSALYILGIIAEGESKRIEAHDLLRRYLEEAPEGPVVDPGEVAERTEAKRILALPRPEAGEVQIVGERGALVLVDGRLVGSLPLSLPLLLTPGTHEVTLQMGRKQISGPIVVSAGRSADMRFNQASGAVLVTLRRAALILPLRGGGEGLLSGPLASLVERELRKAQLASMDWEAARKVAQLATIDDLRLCHGNSPIVKDCLRRLREGLDLEYLLVPQIPPAKKGGKVALSLVDVVVEEVAAQGESPCGECGAEAVRGELERLLKIVLEQGSTRKRGTLSLTSDPPSAKVFVSGKERGFSPWKGILFAGTYTVGANKPGYKKVESQVVVNGDTQVELRLVSDRPTDVEPPPAPLLSAESPLQETWIDDRRPRWRLGVSAAAIASGSVLGAFGIAALAVDGGCISVVEPIQACPQFYDTKGVGAGLLTSGLVLAGAGIGLLVWPTPKKRVLKRIENP